MGLNSLDFQAFVVAAFEVGHHLKHAYGVARCGMFFEGYEIDYAQLNLIPVHEEKLLVDGGQILLVISENTKKIIQAVSPHNWVL